MQNWACQTEQICMSDVQFHYSTRSIVPENYSKHGFQISALGAGIIKIENHENESFRRGIARLAAIRYEFE